MRENVRMQKMWEENKIVDKTSVKKINTSKAPECMIFSKKLRTPFKGNHLLEKEIAYEHFVLWYPKNTMKSFF